MKTDGKKMEWEKDWDGKKMGRRLELLSVKNLNDQ